MTRIGDFQGIGQHTGRVVVDEGGALKASTWRGKVASQLKGQYRTENNKAKSALVLAIKNAYGNAAASAAELKLNVNDGKPLRGRQVREVLAQHVQIQRQPTPLQKGDVSLLLMRAGVKGADGLNLRPEMIAQLRTDVGALAGDSPMLDQIVMSSDEQLRTLVAASLGVTDPQAAEVTTVMTAIRDGCPNKFLANGDVVVNGTTYGDPQELARGANGMAVKYTAADKSTIVIKTAIPGGMMDELELADSTRKEVQTHRYAMQGEGMGKEHVAPLLAPLRTPGGGIAVAMKNCEFGDVKKMFAGDGVIKQAVDGNLMSAKAAKLVKARIALDVVKAMHYLQHSRQMMHLDLKPANVFMDRKGVLQLGDFGEGVTKLSARVVAGTREYMAPGLSRESGSTIKADTYSVGVMLYELYTGRRPFFDEHPEQPMNAQTSRKNWFKTHTGLAEGENSTGDPDIDALVNGLTHQNDQERMTFEDAMKSPLFAGLTKDGAERQEARDLLVLLAGHQRLEKLRERATAEELPRVETAAANYKQQMMQTSAAIGIGA